MFTGRPVKGRLEISVPVYERDSAVGRHPVHAGRLLMAVAGALLLLAATVPAGTPFGTVAVISPATGSLPGDGSPGTPDRTGAGDADVGQSLAVTAVSGTTYYVAVSGSDNNPGTMAEPWRTIQKAANTVSAGDTVLIGPGTYGERVTISRSGTSGSPITFTAQSSRPKISRGLSISGSYVDFSQFTPWPMAASDNADVGAVQISGSQNRVHHFDIPTGSLGGSAIYLSGGGSYNTVSDFAVTDAAWCGASYGPGTSHSIIKDGYIHGFGDNVAVGNLDGDYNTLENVEITGVGVAHKVAGWQSMAYDGDGIHPGPGATNITIRGCKIHHIFPQATDAAHTDCIQWWYPVTNFVIEDCVLGSWATCPPGVGGTTGQGDCFNAIFMVSGAEGPSNTIIRNNIILGIGDYPATSSYFLSSNEAGDLVTIDFYNNTVFTDRNVMIKPNLRGSFKNNIFITDMHLQGTGSLTWSNNLWLKAGYAVGTNNVFGDALFVDPDISAATEHGVNADFHLTSQSPAIDKGVTDANTPSTDADGNARVGAPDIGAFEYGTLPPDGTPPGPVTALKATSSDRSVVLSWTNPTDPDFSAVRVKRSTSRYADSATDADGQTTIYQGASTTKVDSGLVNGTTYYYTAFARDTSGNWSDGTAITAKPEGSGDQVVPQRVSAADRYATAVELSRRAFEDGSASDIVVTSGQDFPDALCASGLAGALDSPILLVPASGVPSSVSAEIARLAAPGPDTTVWVVGGSKAVSSAAFSALDSIAGVDGVTRVAGADRYATSRAVADAIADHEGSAFADAAFVANGLRFPDALSAASLAWANKWPVLLTNSDSLPSAVSQAISGNGVKRVVVVGGTGAVSSRVVSAIDAIVGVSTPERWAGADRYGTSVAVAEKADTGGLADMVYVGIASGEIFPDALAGAPVAGAAGGTCVLTGRASLPSATKSFLTKYGANGTGAIESVDIYGGPVSVSDNVKDQVRKAVSGL